MVPPKDNLRKFIHLQLALKLLSSALGLLFPELSLGISFPLGYGIICAGRNFRRARISQLN
jgi:hypothetical protein